MYRARPPDPARQLRFHAQHAGLHEADVELVCAAYRAAEHWPDQFADRLGHGPGAGVVLRSAVAGALDELAFVEAFQANAAAYRIILCWLLDRPLPQEVAWTA